MTSKRWGNVQPQVQTNAAALAVNAVPTTPDPIEDPIPPALRKAEARTPLGVRAKPSLQANLNELVADYKRKGWSISQHTVLEHFLRRLGDPEYARAFMLDMAQTGESGQ